ncbi:MAG TPA: alpha-glucan family phosphorylase [Planctomycetota bacterium]|nr:alpha-glucan family phosphorylase [Planctomycetota bacterium]
MNNGGVVAYFSMEMALERGMPTYSGGLGILAGDTIRAAADLKVPMVAVIPLHRKGYFFQRLDASGWQSEQPVEWVIEDFVEEMDPRVTVELEGRTVHLRSWKYVVTGVSGATVTVYLLDTDLPENSECDRHLTDRLYGGDTHHRLCQETILGMGGVRMLRALGYDNVERFHMNEGHAALLTLALLEERSNGSVPTPEDIVAVKEKCVFTTHTPVVAGHDKFPVELRDRILGRRPAFGVEDFFCYDEALNMTHLALSLSHYVNGVAKKHGEVSRSMFAPYVIDSITNGVNATTWTASPFRKLYYQYIPGWKEDNFMLRNALNIPPEEIWEAHQKTKRWLIEKVNRETNAGMDLEVLTLGFARRAATYKRADLIFHDIDRLKRIAAEAGAFQLIYAGKAHPHDKAGKEVVQRIFQAGDRLAGSVRVVYLPNYDWELGKVMTSGVDVWLNTPKPPLEASGTSGMKAALNGVPSLSIMDGWWIEGCIEGVTGWAIGEADRNEDDANALAKDAQVLYDKLENVVIPTYYNDRPRFIDIMRHAIALNGSFFNTQRMMQQYVLRAYFS